MSLYRPKLAYYADDFTGATDALERLALAGVSVRLFTSPPTPTQLSDADWPDAIGVAGRSRALPTAAMAEELLPVFQGLLSLRPRHVHYKICSTFDSSPGIGSIGEAIRVTRAFFPQKFAPIVVGSPAFARWVVFGNLFAGVGIGAESAVFRLDRHPSMSIHPVTPAVEADLRRRLAEQSVRTVSLLDWRWLGGGLSGTLEKLRQIVAEETPDAVVFDTINEAHLHRVGEVLEALADEHDAPLLSVGSSAVESALLSAWGAGRGEGVAEPSPTMWPALILVGSCSPVTRAQVQRAIDEGVAVQWLEPRALDPVKIAGFAGQLLARGQSVLVATRLDASGCTRDSLPADHLGEAFASIVELCREELGDGLLVIAGGDTATCVVTMLGVRSLRYVASLTPGAPVCEASAPSKAINGLRMVLKGGQVGGSKLLATFLTHPDPTSACKS